MSAEGPCCANCVFFTDRYEPKGKLTSNGCCRRYPPSVSDAVAFANVVLGQEPDGESVPLREIANTSVSDLVMPMTDKGFSQLAAWPAVNKSDWCGEYLEGKADQPPPGYSEGPSEFLED